MLDAIDKFFAYLSRIHHKLEKKYLEDTRALMIFGQLKGGAPVDAFNAKTRTIGQRVLKRMTLLRKTIKTPVYLKARLPPRGSYVDFAPGEKITDGIAPVDADPLSLISDHEATQILEETWGSTINK